MNNYVNSKFYLHGFFSWLFKLHILIACSTVSDEKLDSGKGYGLSQLTSSLVPRLFIKEKFLL